MNALEIARSYVQRGWNPVPIPPGLKGPRDDQWQARIINAENVGEYFNGAAQNIGLMLGPNSNGLTDIDLDCDEAVHLGGLWLPKTGAIFGRASKPRSHYLYYTADPEQKAAIAINDEQGQRIIELRMGGGGRGAQTMAPGSVHPSGEAVEWATTGEPAHATCAVLKAAITKIAVATILIRLWPSPSSHNRHDAALRVGGFLARAGWTADDTDDFVETVAGIAEDEEHAKRGRAARDAAEAYALGTSVFGRPAMEEFFGKRATDHIVKLLGYRDTAQDDELLERMNGDYFVINLNGKARVGTFKRETPDGEQGERLVPVFSTFDDFKNLHLHETVPGSNGKPMGRGAWWLKNPNRLQYSGMVFRPGGPSVINDDLNLWRGWGIEPRKGSWPLMQRHIYKVLANGNKEYFKYIVRWTAWCLQNPDKRAEVALVFKGGRGTGKGLFGRALKNIFGQHGRHISSADQLAGRFNAHFVDCALLFADEAYWPGDKSAEGTLKRMITEGTLFIEPKGIDSYEVTNTLKIVMATNEGWAVPAGTDERRFAVFKVSETYKQKADYFNPLHAEMENGGIAAMMHDLLDMDLHGWHPRYDVPQTAALREQQERSLSPEDQWWLSLLEDGVLPRGLHVDPAVAPASALYEHARATVPKLKSASDIMLARVLKDRGAKRGPRIKDIRHWHLPDLKQARAAWGHRAWSEADEWQPATEQF